MKVAVPNCANKYRFLANFRRSAAALTGLLSITGCVGSPNLSFLAKSIGRPITYIEQAENRRETTEPGSVKWSDERRYSLSPNLRVFPYAPTWGCSEEYIVNDDGIIVGFNQVGESCQYLRYPSPWRAF